MAQWMAVGAKDEERGTLAWNAEAYLGLRVDTLNLSGIRWE